MTMTQNTADTLLDLFQAVDGQIGVYLDASNCHHNTLAALLRRDYIETKREETIPFAALTKAGRDASVALHPKMTSGTSTKRFSKPDERIRVPVRLNLDVDRAGHVETLAYVERLKTERKFTPVFCEALRLYEALSAGDTSVLIEMFPDALEDAIAAVERKEANIQFEAMLQQAMSRIESKLDTVTVPSSNGQPSPATPGGLQKLDVPQFEAPQYDDDDNMELTVTAAKSDGSAARNFLASMQALQAGV